MSENETLSHFDHINIKNIYFFLSSKTFCLIKTEGFDNMCF